MDANYRYGSWGTAEYVESSMKLLKLIPEETGRKKDSMCSIQREAIKAELVWAEELYTPKALILQMTAVRPGEVQRLVEALPHDAHILHRQHAHAIMSLPTFPQHMQ